MGKKKSSKQTRGRARPSLSHACEALGSLAPNDRAQSWDNVGLLAGDVSRPIRRALLCIDLTPLVADEAVKRRSDLVVAYHPPIFKPVNRLTAQSDGPEAAVFRCISHNIAVYSPHTALDAARGGTNDVLADLCGIEHTEPLEYAADGPISCKLVTFVPAESMECVAEAMFAAGAGRIGDYSRCSYRLSGYGTFLGGKSTRPAVGKAGALERVDEIRLEMVCPARKTPQVSAALVAAHPYEEPAYDIYPLTPPPAIGIGRVGCLPRPTTLGRLARRLKRATQAHTVQIVGEGEHEVARAVIVVGAAGSLPFSMSLEPDDVIVTGEIRHHDALSILRLGCTAIALNHWTSERPALHSLGTRLARLVPGLEVRLSEADREPFRPV